MKQLSTLENLNSSAFTKKPKPKKKTRALVIVASILVLFVVLVFISIQQQWINITFSSNSGQQTQQTPRQLPDSENDEIALLQPMIEDAFINQVQAYFMEEPDKEDKVLIYEDLMTRLGQAYYRYYVTEGNGNISDAMEAMRQYVINFEADGITLSPDSVDYFLERVRE